MSAAPAPRAAGVITLLVFCLAFALRAGAAAGDFWLDEIWSWMAVRDRVHSIGDVFFAIRHEANHLTNSLWIYALGVDVDWRWYRLPAVVAGSLAVLIARHLSSRAGPCAQWLVTLLCVPSFLLVTYASEARGYGVLMLCALASLWLLEVHGRARDDVRRRRCALLGFWLATMLGTMAHASFGATLLALALWSALRLARDERSVGARLAHFVWVFGPPLVVAMWLWLVNFRDVEIGGGPVMGAWQAAALACSLAVGGPGEGRWVWPLAGLVLAALAAEVMLLARARDDRAWLWLLMLLVPAVPLAAGVHNQYIYPRFFLGGVVFLLVALASLGARGWSAGGALRLVVGGIALLITVGNLDGLARLLRDGRGQPAAAVSFMAEHSRHAQILIATDHAFRHGMTLDYYRHRLHAGQSMQLLVDTPWPAPGPEWILRQQASRHWQPAPALHDAQGHTYQLEAFYPHAGLSGFSLALYHRSIGPESVRPD